MTEQISSGPAPPARQQGLKAKIEFMRYCVDLRRLEAFRDRPDLWVGHMQNVQIGVALGVGMTAGNWVENANTLVAKWINGSKPVSREQLSRIADHAQLGSAALTPGDGAWLLSDACDFSEFRRRLVSSGWADPGTVVGGQYASRDLLLEALREGGLRRGGLLVTDRRPPSPSAERRLRAARLPRPEDALNDVPDFPVGAHLEFVVEGLQEESGLLLLELSPAPEKFEAYAIASLVPSALAPTPSASPAERIPTTSVNGISCFVMDGPSGRHDWIALLTARPLSPPWPAAPGEIYKLTPQDLDWLLREMRRLRRDPTLDDPEVLHFPFTLGAG